MDSEEFDPSKHRFAVFINEIQQNFVFGDGLADRYTKTVTLSDGTTRKIELTPMIRNGELVVEFKDNGHTSYMGLNGTSTHDKLMVQISDYNDVLARRRKEGLP